MSVENTHGQDTTVEDGALHVSVGGYPTEDELRQIRNDLRGTFPDHTVVVSSDTLALAEIPALDEYADELAKRVAEELDQ